MILRTDYHTHTPLCLHAEGEPEAFVQRALELGLTEYGIADHAPALPEMEPFDNWRMRYDDLPLYWDWIARAKAAAAGTELTIRVGLECDWIIGKEDWITHLRGLYDWDYLIGSVHYLALGAALDDPVYADRCTTGSVEKDWEIYWQNALTMVQSGLFDLYGHIDIMKIWGRVPAGRDLSLDYAPLLDALAGQGSAVELNAAGWYKRCAEQYPSDTLLRALMERGIPLCINSDAHHPEQVSRDWDRALTLLTELSPTGSLRQCPAVTAHGGRFLILLA